MDLPAPERPTTAVDVPRFSSRFRLRSTARGGTLALMDSGVMTKRCP